MYYEIYIVDALMTFKMTSVLVCNQKKNTVHWILHHKFFF